MEGTYERYKLIYDYYAARICFGRCAFGDSLPAIPRIASEFHVAVPTVRSALARLEADGLIRVEAKKAARVVYRAGPARFRENAARYFVPRREGILDIVRTGGLLYDPLWEAGLRTWNRERTGAPPAAAGFSLTVLSSLGNHLVMNLCWEMIRYLCFPLLDAHGAAEDCLRELRAGGDADRAKRVCPAGWKQDIDELFAFLETARAEYALEDVRPVPFEWNIYRQRPQLRYSIASRIIREILEERYPVGSFLPSLPRMAERFGVAVSTIRRTLDLLAGLGVAVSFQGKGTRVLMDPRRIDFSKPEVREALGLYAESLEFLALTVRKVSLFTLEAASGETLDRLAERFARIREEKKSYLVFEAYLAFITGACPSAAVRQCYRKLNELLACGYPATLRRLGENRLDNAFSGTIAQAEADLRARDFERIAAGWQVFLESEAERFRDFAARQ